jgi:hypothetical protein
VVRMMHVASSQRLCQTKAENGWIDVTDCIGPFYPNFAVFIVFGPSGILCF